MGDTGRQAPERCELELARLLLQASHIFKKDQDIAI